MRPTSVVHQSILCLPSRYVRQRSWRIGSSFSSRAGKPRRPQLVTKGLPIKPTAALSTPDIINRTRSFGLRGAMIVATGMGIYFGVLVTSYLSPQSHCGISCPSGDAIPTGRPPMLSGESARQFDQSLNMPEWLMGITSLRKKVAERARGHVLEVALGTGRNMAFYDWSHIVPRDRGLADDSAYTSKDLRPGASPEQLPITSFTGVDISSDMLGVAIEKFAEVSPGITTDGNPMVRTHLSSSNSSWGEQIYLSGKLRIVRSDIQDFIPSPSSTIATGAKYDTIVQTFGLCSVADPVQALRNLASLVQPDTGRIILIEHGRGWWDVINNMLDNTAGSHFQKYGCWWNRDIERIIQDAIRECPTLNVVALERPYLLQLGTTFWIELKVSSDPGKAP